MHLHCIVTAGGLDPTRRRWLRRPGGFLFPVRALSRVFRGKYLAALRADPNSAASVPLHTLREHEWVVYAKKPFGGPRQVLDYLSRYTHRVALTNDRLLTLRHGIVHLRWRDYAHGGKKKVLRLDPTDLLARFVRHVLPRGLRRVRHYGLLANRHKSAKLASCRRYFGTSAPRQPATRVARTLRILHRIGIELDRCRACGSLRILREPLPAQTPLPRARAPDRSRG